MCDFLKKEYKKRKQKIQCVCETFLPIFVNVSLETLLSIDFISVKTTFIGCFRFWGCEVCAGRQGPFLSFFFF